MSKNSHGNIKEKPSMVMKYWKELKENKILLGIGDKQDSGS